jgi:hypothetical protein
LEGQQINEYPPIPTFEPIRISPIAENGLNAFEILENSPKVKSLPIEIPP